MKVKIFWTIFYLLILVIPTYGAGGNWLNHDAVLFVEPGDSYIKLFGNDWLKVFQTNNNIAFYDKHGQLACTPEKLVVGTRLIIPKGTYITNFTTARFSSYERIKKDALQAIHMAETFVNQDIGNSSDIYKQGVNLLKNAKQFKDEITFGFNNYFKAKKMAGEAIRCFKIDHNIRKANLNVKKLKTRIGNQKFFLKKQIEILNKQWATFTGLVAALFIIILWFKKFKKRKKRIIRTERWLKQHMSRVNALKNVKI